MTAVAVGDVQKPFAWQPFLAPFHSVVLHLPIGFITVACILELFRRRNPGKQIQQATVLIIWLGLFAGIVSAGLGLLRAQGGGYESHALDLHRAFGLCIPAVSLATLILQKLAYRNSTVRGWTAGYLLFLFGNLALVVVAGHFGGNLTHGSKYLVENAPEFVRELMEEDSPATDEITPGILNDKQRNYVETVQPIFQQKCYSCHGAEKQKGSYRLDLPDVALKGGDSGKTAITPGDPFESYLLRLILLPPDHDDLMPPSGKQSLTPEEIMAIINWIREGAVFPDAALHVQTP